MASQTNSAQSQTQMTQSQSISASSLPPRVGSPTLPLAPLEYLQNQRRGSITDPSLHAASPGLKHTMNPRQGDSTGASDISKAEARSNSPFVFGDATPNTENNSQLRKLLHSPSLDHPSGEMGHENGAGSSAPDTSMRRASIAGTKRKMSGIFPGVDQIDPQLVGPGMPNMDVDSGAPAPKRRGSAIDTQRIAQLSLNDRRNSADSRWWQAGERRDSSGFPPTAGESRGPPPGIATFAWPPSDAATLHNHQVDPHLAAMNTNPMMPSIPIPPDRRMSAPESSQTRVLRSRSRPPSRQMRAPDQQSTPSSGQDEPAPSPTSGQKSQKESSTTPYSRSPELRVSHKLAERKRRKEMKDLFDELRDALPADRGMKSSKWEILSKAVEFVAQLKQSHQEMAREIDVLRHELEVTRQASGMPPFPPGGPPPPHVVYAQGPPYPMPPQPSISRPPSSQNQNPYPPQPGSTIIPPQNGNRPTDGPPPT